MQNKISNSRLRIELWAKTPAFYTDPLTELVANFMVAQNYSENSKKTNHKSANCKSGKMRIPTPVKSSRRLGWNIVAISQAVSV